VVGFVGSIADYINKAAVSVCPANSGSGIQNKILEALACGVPVVATSLAKGDIRLDENDGIFVSDTADSFADKVIEIMTDIHLQNAIKKRAPLAVQKNYSWEKSNITVENIYFKITKPNYLKGAFKTHNI
jgi:polysaccharide biosynthesis protein PslH